MVAFYCATILNMMYTDLCKGLVSEFLSRM
jgi:hypothetical protein